MFLAGVAAGWAVVTEYPLVFASAAILAYAVVNSIFQPECTPSSKLSTLGPRPSAHQSKLSALGSPPSAGPSQPSAAWQRLIPFIVGAGLCAAVLAFYNAAAFGGPFDIGYFHVVHPEFQEVYSAEHPLGLRRPTFERAWKILFSSHGLIWYAPVVMLAPFGLVKLWRAGRRGIVLVITAAFGGVFLVNAAHPTWTGGASTGPRYVQPGLVFLTPAIAAFLADAGRWRKTAFALLALAGFVICLGATAVPAGGRLPDYGQPRGENPIVDAIYADVKDGRLGRNFGNVLLYGTWKGPQTGNHFALLPLLDFLIVGGGLLYWRCRIAERGDQSP